MSHPLQPDQEAEVIAAFRSGTSAIELAARYGRTRQGIYELLKRNGVPRGTHFRVERKCGWCGTQIQVPRHRARRARVSYCNMSCYMERIRTTEYQEHRHGSRLAHAAVAEVFPLLYGNVVHHIDGDQSNNDLGNLMVFANHGDHMRWHRGGGEASGVTPLWRPDRWQR